MSWTKIGGPADSLAVYGDRVAALTPDKKAVYIQDPSTGVWKKIRGAAKALVGGGWDLYAFTRSHVGGLANLIRYDGVDWRQAGGPHAEVVAICNGAYALDPDLRKLSRFNRYTEEWKDIGNIGTEGAFHLPKKMTLIGGGSKLYVAGESKEEIWEYSRFTGKLQKIGGAASMWVGAGETVYGLAPDKSAVYRYNGTPHNWTKIGGPAKTLIGGGSVPYAIHPETFNILRYKGTGNEWHEIGTPGKGFVAVGDTIYGMTTDKSEVYMFDDANDESKRLRNILNKAFDDPSKFGNRVVRGFLVKALHGEILAEYCSDVCFQPLSILKLLPYLYAFIDLSTDPNKSLSNTKISWIEPKTGSDTDTPCLDPFDPNNRKRSWPLEDALPTMMWESHGRTLDSVLSKYGPLNITKKAQSLGLKQTEMYFGCPQPNGPAIPWADNVTTLLDLAKLFEGVENLSFVNSHYRAEFVDNMQRFTANPGTKYYSPITLRTSGPSSNEILRDIVKKEAGPKIGIVDSFMKDVVIRFKGGGGGPTGNETGYSSFMELILPFKLGGKIVRRRFIAAWYIYQIKSASASIDQTEIQKLFAFNDSMNNEIHRVPIRMALNTW